jgi:hypothetical protein
VGIGGKKEKEKKMRKAKVITALSLTVVMLAAMTGIAAANPASVNIPVDPIINPLDDSTVTTTTSTTSHIDYTNLGASHTRYIYVETDDVNLQANLSGHGGVTGFVNTGGGGYTYTANSGDYTFTLEVKGTANGKHVTVHDNAGNSYDPTGGSDRASCTRPVNVPEFATIAIPVAAILGLVLFFNHRKHKKE